ncbi:hypothetical protein [Empedobacter brevis]|uniref:hypothetical protein n=1 Tax=Empedobacter brevis TaxID=247 RepID=UPI0039B02C50
MKKTLLIIFSIFLHNQTYAQTKPQMGVNTDSPKSSVDVNGDFGLRKRIFLDNNGKESKGNKGQILVSQGEGLPPTWKTLRIPEYEPNKFYLIFNDSFSDLKGLGYSGNQNSSANLENEVVENAQLSNLLSKGFQEIEDLAKTFTINSKVSKVYFQFETVVQQNNTNLTDGENIKYACGIFIDKQLKSVRVNTLSPNPSAGTFLTHTQIGGASGLPVGTHSVNVACAKFSGTTITFGIGRSVRNSNTNAFMTQSSLKVDVYEIPENFNTIFD